MFTDDQKDMFRRLVDARRTREADKKALEKSEADYRELEAEVWDALTEDGLLSRKDATIRVPLGGDYGTFIFSPAETFYGRILNEEQALEYLEDRAMLDEATKPKIVMARINEIVNQAREAGEAPPPGMDFYPRRYITITQQK